MKIPSLPRTETPENHELNDVVNLDLIHLPGFHVVDRDSANWVIRKIVEARRYAENAKAYAAAEIARAQSTEKFFLWQFGRELEAWVDQQLADGDRPGPARKSLNLPAGKVGRRAVPAKLVIDDDQTVLAWAKKHCPDAITVVEKISKITLNAHFEQTGELPDGVSITDPCDQFYVK